MPRQPQPKYSTDFMGIPFGPGHPLYDPIKIGETSPTPTLTQEQIEQMIADQLAGQQQGVASLAERISQHLTSSSNPEYMKEFDTNQDGKLSVQDVIFAKQFDAGLRDPETLEAIQTQEQPDLNAAIQSALAGQDFSQYMTAADAEELLRNMDTSGIESSVLQKMGTADMLTDERMQEAINQALGGAGILGEQDILRILSEQGGPDLSDYLKTGQAEQMFVGQEQVEQMIANGLAQGLTPEQIQAMIAEATGGQINESMIQEMIAEAMAQVETGGLTEEAIQAMIDATGQGASMEQIQNMLGESGYLTQDQIQAMIQESATPSFDPTGLEERLASLEAGAGSGGFDPTGLEQRLAALEAAGATNTGGGATETTPYVPPDSNQYKVSTGPYGYNPYQSGQYQSDPYGPSGVPKMGGVTTLPTPDGYTIYNPYMKQS
tara:strand:- start:507 stop:1811 length:1305 start_codon:yes stop_codon:yes gene_type:complete